MDLEKMHYPEGTAPETNLKKWVFIGCLYTLLMIVVLLNFSQIRSYLTDTFDLVFDQPQAIVTEPIVIESEAEIAAKLRKDLPVISPTSTGPVTIAVSDETAEFTPVSNYDDSQVAISSSPTPPTPAGKQSSEAQVVSNDSSVKLKSVSVSPTSNNRTNVTTTGTVLGVDYNNNLLKLSTNDGVWRVTVTNATKISINGQSASLVGVQTDDIVELTGSKDTNSSEVTANTINVTGVNVELFSDF